MIESPSQPPLLSIETNQLIMSTKIYNLIILDESGSMTSIEKEAIDSVNETLQSIRVAQKKFEDQEHYVTFVTFNDDVKTVYDCIRCDDAKDITNEDYKPQCCTALYDAMGMSLTRLRAKVADDDRVLVTIVTDGYENSSREYNGMSIKALVEELKAKGWVFAYIGANQDVEKVAATISITNTLSFHTTHEGVHKMSSKLSDSRTSFFQRISRKEFNADQENANFFADEEN